MPERKARVHSLESFGTVDGPGVRFVVFLQGCPLRCKYCHNPDTWQVNSGTEMTAEEILHLYDRNASFYRRGGLTCTGGEPLLQMDFVLELFQKAKARGIHTCVDTSGITFRADSPAPSAKVDALCEVTDLFLLDLKHPDPQGHLELTGQRSDNILAFARYLAARNQPIWVRHVVVPGITDSKEEWDQLGAILAELPNVKALEVLPYHTMGVAKYHELGIPYPLEGVPALDRQTAVHARQEILKARKAALEAKAKHPESS